MAKNVYLLTATKVSTYKGFVCANTLEEAEAAKERLSLETAAIRELTPEITTSSTITLHEGDLVAEDVFKVLNSEECLFLSVRSNKENYPFLCSMYDPCDPGHTRGVTDYFVDSLTDMINEENKHEVMKEIKAIFAYDEVIITD